MDPDFTILSVIGANEGIIVRFVAWHSVALCFIVGIIVLLPCLRFRVRRAPRACIREIVEI